MPARAFIDPKITRGDLRVLGVLCAHADFDGGECFPRQSTVAYELGVKRQYVNRIIKRLEARGYVNAIPVADRWGGIDRCRYQIKHTPETSEGCTPPKPLGVSTPETSGGFTLPEQLPEQDVVVRTDPIVLIIFDLLKLGDLDRSNWTIKAIDEWRTNGASDELIVATITTEVEIGHVPKRATFRYFNAAIQAAIDAPKTKGKTNGKGSKSARGKKGESTDEARERRRSAIGGAVRKQLGGDK